MGEEDESEVNILKEPYYVDELEVPAEFTPLIAGLLHFIFVIMSVGCVYMM